MGVHRVHQGQVLAVTASQSHWIQHEKMLVNQAHSYPVEVAFPVEMAYTDVRSMGEPVRVVVVHVVQQMTTDEVD